MYIYSHMPADTQTFVQIHIQTDTFKPLYIYACNRLATKFYTYRYIYNFSLTKWDKNLVR